MKGVTIGMVARDRFSRAARALARLVECTPRECRILVVDAGTPPRYRRAMERAVAGRPGVEFLRADRFLNPNAAKNWVVRETRDGEFLALLENDNLVPPGWLEGLVRACDEERADVARPMIFERKLGLEFPHFDQRLGSLEREGSHYRFRRRTRPLASDVGAPRQRTTVMETHCLLYRRDVFSRIRAFDERINTRQEVDLALELRAADVPVVFEPAVRITYLSPPPVERAERAFYLWRWDLERAKESHHIIEHKWNLQDFPRSVGFAHHRHDHLSYPRFAAYFARYELPHYLRYGVYLAANYLPPTLRDPVHRALYG